MFLSISLHFISSVLFCETLGYYMEYLFYKSYKHAKPWFTKNL